MRKRGKEMDKITIGIPKALLYYKYKDLWVKFFENLGCEIIISPNTNREILENGKKYVLDEACLPMKIYMGHVFYLLDKCDYILTYRISCLKKHEKVCTNFMALYDLTRNIFDKRFIHYNIDVEHGEAEEYSFVTMGLELGFSYRKIQAAYKDAKRYQKLMQERYQSKQKMILGSSKGVKILIAGHPYNLYDNLIGKEISDYLKKEDIDLLYSDMYDTKYVEIDSKKISSDNYFTFNKEILGSIESLKNEVDGIILLTTFPCGPDSLSDEMIVRYLKTPLLLLVIDEANSDTGLITRLESFVDILKERRNTEHARNN